MTPTLAVYLGRIRLARRVPALHALAREIGTRFPDDEATPRLVDVVAAKAYRLAEAR